MNVLFLKPIPQTPGYLVSSQGHICGPRKWLKPCIDKDGYLYVRAYVGSRYKKWLVHRAVYAAFKGEVIPGLNVCHKDGSRQNNSAENLEQKTQRENCADKRIHGTHQAGDLHGRTKYPDNLVREIWVWLAANPRTRGYLTRAAAQFNVPKHFVFDIVRKKRGVSL